MTKSADSWCQGDAALEDVGVVGVVGLGGIGLRDAEQVAELGEKERVVRTLGPAGVLPAGNEALGG